MAKGDNGKSHLARWQRKAKRLLTTGKHTNSMSADSVTRNLLETRSFEFVGLGRFRNRDFANRDAIVNPNSWKHPFLDIDCRVARMLSPDVIFQGSSREFLRGDGNVTMIIRSYLPIQTITKQVVSSHSDTNQGNHITFFRPTKLPCKMPKFRDFWSTP